MNTRAPFLAAFAALAMTVGCEDSHPADPTTVDLGRCSCVCRIDTSGPAAAWGATFVESPESKNCLDVCGAYETTLVNKTCRPLYNSKYEVPRTAFPTVSTYEAPTDSDGDGLPDSRDRCPNESGPASNAGCPVAGKPVADKDSDGDGIMDSADKCPNEQETKNGYQDDDGCPDEVPAAIAKFSGAIEGVVFKTGSAELDTKSVPVLTKAAEVFKQYSDIRVEISGHTDNVGNEKANTVLSQKRAESVKAWFVKNGIDQKRLEAKGFGPSKPVADNRAADGRAKNRRVEFHLIQ